MLGTAPFVFFNLACGGVSKALIPFVLLVSLLVNGVCNVLHEKEFALPVALVSFPLSLLIAP